MQAKYNATSHAVLSRIGTLVAITTPDSGALRRRSLTVTATQLRTAKMPKMLHIPDAKRHPLEAFAATGPVTAADTVLPNESAVA